MRILFINSTMTWGGGEVWLTQICRGLSARGHDIAVACQPGSKLSERLGAVPVHGFTVRMPGDFSPLAIARLYRLITRHGIDLVCATTDKALRIGGIAARAAAVPVIICREVDFPIKDKRINRIFYTRIASGIMVNSHATHNTLLVSAPWLAEQRLEVVWKGVDTEHYDGPAAADLRDEFNLGPEDCVAGFIGRLDEQKGIPTLLEAMAEAVKQNPHLKLILAGEGNLRGRIEEFRVINRLGHHIIMAGFREDVLSVLKAIDFLVMPSYWEGFGYAAVEAMAAGKPVIASSASSLPEVVENGRTGILVPPRSAEDLAAAMVSLSADPRLQAEMGRAGKLRARKLFRLASMVTRTESFFLSIVEPARYPIPELSASPIRVHHGGIGGALAGTATRERPGAFTSFPGPRSGSA